MVYTPMMVVNGLTHVNGSDESKVQQAIESSAKVFAATQVPLRLSESGSHIVIEAGAAQQGGPAKEATVWLAQLANSVAVPITRGENRGKTITYHNVVRDLVPVGLWSGQPITVQLDRPSVVRPGAERCAAFLQQGRGGPIIGAAELLSADGGIELSLKQAKASANAGRKFAKCSLAPFLVLLARSLHQDPGGLGG